ncbi:MAG: urea ABC transporter ATP-binding subunit UrtE [Planctomycetota bacterium]|nr:urea ABC transporter ATP-binding subunit UrtE [Planctomycetota bacterium]MCX8040007.1 urea ABC transporter ATP-binding subunit UrtE [Planctomycetota bacterium]MDW8372903.1 urea ABC transporter ATP-binding subunit UrtE [Planctomycetota bacterium]
MSELAVEGLVAGYGAVRVLHGVSLSVRGGEILCVMGRNGVGKTTCLRAIMGQMPAWQGRVLLDGRDVTAQPAHARARAGLGLVPQGREIFPRLTVRENLEVAFSARGAREPSAIAEVLEIFPALRALLPRAGGDLSGGQQQQLAIARALVGRPRVLLLDEPTEGIQPNIVEEIGLVLRRLAKQGLAIILVEQYLDFVTAIGDRFAIVDRGSIVASGSTRELDAELVRRWLSV